MTQLTDSPKDYGTKLAEERTDLAQTRTRLAFERTLAAWVRTALSMISFGFTIYKFLQELQQKQAILTDRPYAGRNFGLALVGMGTLCMIAAAYQHVVNYHAVGLHPLRRPISIALVIGCFIILLGLLVLIGIAARIGPF